jgi:glycosyltransferase involved in cell wall biosynthesis
MQVSVIIPTFNRRALIGSAIDSALAQQGVDVEVLVVDDGSTDGTVAWLAEAYGHRPVRVLANAGRKGPAGGRNTGLAAATGHFVALLDSDDRFLPGHLAAAVGVMARHADVGVVFGRARYLKAGAPVDYMGPNFTRKLGLAPKIAEDEQSALMGPGFFEHLLEQGCWFNLSSVVLSRAAAQERMHEDLRVAEDYEYWVRLSRRFSFACLKAEQIEYTLGDDNISFEADESIEGHAPQLMRAYDHILSYPGLSITQQRLVEARMAEELFDWGYRASQRGRPARAIALHARSWAYGMRARNSLALLKTALRVLLPRRTA